MTEQQLVLEEGATGCQNAGVGTQGGIMYSHGHIAEEALTPLCAKGFQHRLAGVVEVDVVHGLCAGHHGRRRRVTGNRMGVGVGEGG